MDAGEMDAFRELQDLEVIVRPPADLPERGPYVGIHEMALVEHEANLRRLW
jgi:hypothetical protein